MTTTRYAREIIARTKSIIKKTIVWAGALYVFYIFHTPQSDYISKQISDAVVKGFIFMLMGLFMLMGFYITLTLFLGNENDIEKVCLFVLENHISIMLAIILNR
jgi:hypothetical protein